MNNASKILAESQFLYTARMLPFETLYCSALTSVFRVFYHIVLERAATLTLTYNVRSINQTLVVYGINEFLQSFSLIHCCGRKFLKACLESNSFKTSDHNTETNSINE